MIFQRDIIEEFQVSLEITYDDIVNCFIIFRRLLHKKVWIILKEKNYSN